ncbi:hypothetical protein M8J76_006232 [Diaphorina citri]|nr:hypothetical protein M8J76_006232 [Diaphorina citri]
MANVQQTNPVVPAVVTESPVREVEIESKPISDDPINQTIVGDLGYAGVSLTVNKNQMPRTVNKVEKQLEYLHDPFGRYSLFKYSQREIESFSSYEEWLVKLMRLTLREVDEMYCMYHLDDEDVIDHVSMTSLDAMGFGTDLTHSKMDTLPRLLSMLHQARTPVAENVRYKEVTIVMHPTRRDCHAVMQDRMFNVAIEPHLEWIREFMLRKKLSPMHGAEMRSGSAYVNWLTVASPRRLPIFLDVLPDLNSLHVAYSASFVSPMVELADVNLSNLSQVTGVTVTKSTSVGNYLNTPINGENMKDFRAILLSWVLPTQVVLNIKCDSNSYEPRKIIDCLAAKLLCSRSEGCSNVTRMSAMRVDEILRQYAIHLGIRAPEGDGVARGNTRAAAIAAWNLIMTNPGGIGWLNEGCNPHHVIENPLYEGVNMLPTYGGLLDPVAADSILVADPLPNPPIYQNIIAALQALSNASGRQGEEVRSLISILETVCPKWKISLAMLNEHIRTTGETGFRLTTAKVFAMEGQDEIYDNNAHTTQRQIVIDVSLSSFGLLLRQMPRIYSPSDKIPQQPKFESVFSSELQRFFNSIIRARAIANSKKELIRVAMEVGEMSVIKDVLSMSLDTMKHLFTIDPVNAVSAHFDDVKTLMMEPVYDMIQACPELYGFTNSIVHSLDHVEIVDRNSYNERISLGMLTSNTTARVRNPERRMIRMSLDEMRRHLYDGDLLSAIREAV